MTVDPGPDKERARAVARRARRNLDFDAISVAIVGHLREWLGGDETLLAYMSLPDEPDVASLGGPEVLVTRTNEDGTLTVHPFDSALERHPYGFQQPVGSARQIDPSRIDVALVPGLAFDEAGTRLGRGAGYYDELLARLRRDALVVGVAPDAAVVERLPREAHDVAMTHIVTESGVRPVGRFGAMQALTAAAAAWIATDPDSNTREELQAIVDAGDTAELERRMGAALRFGTAGIRGVVGAGSGMMNRAVVIRATAGVVSFLAAEGRGGEPVVLGYDGRTSSRQFAADAAGVLEAAGIPVRYFGSPTPTPLVAFAAKDLGATAAVVITASHNPAPDNGYKVYDSNAAQIIPPVDASIAAAIAAAPAATEVTRREGVLEGASHLGAPITDAEERYLDEVFAFRGPPPPGPSPQIVYTPLHGVGGALALRALDRAGHSSVVVVAEQFEPDGAFPTVAYPNPEEPGALDLAEALAGREGADLVLANDPDADRLAVSLFVEGAWRRLSGNEIGVLLAEFVLRRMGAGSGDLVVNSVVSSPMLGEVAAAHGARFEQTLTGFKWIANAAMDLAAEGWRFVFGYEEALGFTVGPVVRDKDGIATAVWFADLAAAEAERGRTVMDRLHDLWAEHGLWMGAQHSVKRPGADGAVEIAAAMGRLRTATPDSVAGRSVVRATDYAEGADGRPRWLPAANLVVLHLEGGGRVLARPSGTEPKLKFYADVRGTDDPDAVREEAGALVRALAAAVGLE